MGNTYVVGIGATTRYPIQAIPYLIQTTQQGFIAKLDPDGNRLRFREIPPSSTINAVTVLSDGTVATAGSADVDDRRVLNIILFDPADGSVLN